MPSLVQLKRGRTMNDTVLFGIFLFDGTYLMGCVMENGEATKFDEEATKFLERDFNQCFMQMRHYDSQIWNICRFAFIAYIAILGTVMGMYQYSVDKSLDLMPAAMFVLGAGFVLGLLIYGLAIRNRVYFLVVCRYINEHRKLFLKAKPLGFENISGMYVNPAMPSYFNWISWQSWLYCIIAFLNALLPALLTFYFFDGGWALTVAIGTITALAQIGAGIVYLKSREGAGKT